MRFLFVLVIALSGSAAQACVFGGLSIADVKSSPRFSVQDMEKVPFPQAILQAFGQVLGEFNDPSCRHSFVRERITDNKTGQIYAAYRSVQDDCDGGNSYGVIVAGLSATVESVRATIQDSDIYCLK